MELASEIRVKLSARLSLASIRAELDFLSHIDSQPDFYTEPFIRRALYRSDIVSFFVGAASQF
jgi:hypothetical protein